MFVPGRFIKSGNPRGRPTPPGRRMPPVPTPAVPRLKDTMTEAYFNERLEGQGWPRFDAEVSIRLLGCGGGSFDKVGWGT